jgi:hypothetical protein
MRKKIVRICKKRYSCVDGPWEGDQLWLSDGETAIIRIGQEVGRYITRHAGSVCWEPAQ